MSTVAIASADFFYYWIHRAQHSKWLWPMVYFVHLNSPIGFGWFNRVISSPQNHRIHHSRLPEHFDKLAVILPLWDILFGTYYHPKEQEFPRTGVEGVRITSLRSAIVHPFVSWRKMLTNSESSNSTRSNITILLAGKTVGGEPPFRTKLAELQKLPYFGWTRILRLPASILPGFHWSSLSEVSSHPRDISAT